MLGGGASVSWHLAAVGPVVISDVVDELQAKLSTMNAMSDTNAQGCRPLLLATPAAGGYLGIKCIDALNCTPLRSAFTIRQRTAELLHFLH